MSSKIRVKVGGTEVEFEGSEDFMRDELPKLITLLGELRVAAEKDDESLAAGAGTQSTTERHGKKSLQMTTNTISSRLKAKTGVELILAVCIHLSLVKNADKFSRSDILKEMKNATNFFKQSHSANLTKSLKTLVSSGKLLETSQDTYALQANEKTRLEELIHAT